MCRIKVLVSCFVIFVLCTSPAWISSAAAAPRTVPMIATTVQLPPSVKEPVLVSKIGALQAADLQKLGNAAKLLLSRDFGPSIAQSRSVSPRITVLGKSGNRIKAEALYVFLNKNTYSATVSKVEYEVDGDKVTLLQKIDNFAPMVTAVQAPAKINDNVVKLKGDILKNLKLTPTGYGPKALANTPASDIPTAVSFTNTVHTIFTQAFGSAEKKIGNQSSKAALMDVLQKGTNLLAWNNIGHGNPDLLVEWNHEIIASADFNTTVPFQGIYNSVVLLNSCDTCASPYSLKNAIMKHNPRTYIAGSRGLPIGSSEEVDSWFWNYTLLQNQTMAWSLNEAQKKKNLLGYFCLAGFGGKFAEVEAAKFTEDCIGFNPNQVAAAQVQGRWKVVQGGMMMLDFGNEKAQAEKAVQIIKNYRLDKQCFVGRPQPPMQYFTAGGRSPQGAAAGEDCISFNPGNIAAARIQGRWKVVEGSHWILDFDQKEAEAKIAAETIKFYGFTKQCFVGRPNPPMKYFRK